MVKEGFQKTRRPSFLFYGIDGYLSESFIGQGMLVQEKLVRGVKKAGKKYGGKS